VNPVGCQEFRVAGTIALRCSVSYLRHLAHTPDRVNALLAFARTAWNGIAGGPAYGYGHLAMTLARPCRDGGGNGRACRPSARGRFRRLDDALQPMFLSREETAPIKRGMLGCFYRERPPLE
jgi:hypothetical protein